MKNLTKTRLIAIFFLAAVPAGSSPPACAGGGTFTVAPADVVREALAHSFRLKASDQNIEAAVAREDRARAEGMPSVDAEFQAAHYEGLSAAPFGPGFEFPVIEDRYQALVSITQPLYTGGRISGEKESAGFRKESARYSHLSLQAGLTRDALDGYWGWSKAFYALESLDASVERMEIHAKDMRNLADAGLATENELLSTEVLLDQTRLAREEAQRRVNLARDTIAFLTGSALPEKTLPERPPVSPAVALPAEADALAAARERRPELAAARMEVAAAEALVDVSRSGYYPHLFLQAGYEQARPNILNLPPQDEWEDDAFAALVVTLNLFEFGRTKSSVAEARARAARARCELKQLEDKIDLEVRQALVNLGDALARLPVAERVEESARSNLTVADDLWQSGLARHSDVLDAHSQLTRTEYEVVAARADVVLASAALDHATGKSWATASE